MWGQWCSEQPITLRLISSRQLCWLKVCPINEDFGLWIDKLAVRNIILSMLQVRFHIYIIVKIALRAGDWKQWSRYWVRKLRVGLSTWLSAATESCLQLWWKILQLLTFKQIPCAIFSPEWPSYDIFDDKSSIWWFCWSFRSLFLIMYGQDKLKNKRASILDSTSCQVLNCCNLEIN